MEYERIAIIDADSIVYICSANRIVKDSNGEPIIDDLGEKVKENKTLEECKDLVNDMINTILSMTGSSHYILALTVGKNFRYDIYPEYKGNRKYLDMPKHFRSIKEYLITDWNAIYDHNLEADDIVNICKHYYPNSYICSPDGDLLYLEGTHYDYKNLKWIQTSKEEAELKFWKDMIIGQPGDNIKGIPGKGKVAASGILMDSKFPPARILKNYILHFGEELGIEEFYRNFKLLKIKDKHTGFVIPTPIPVNKVEAKLE